MAKSRRSRPHLAMTWGTYTGSIAGRHRTGRDLGNGPRAHLATASVTHACSQFWQSVMGGRHLTLGVGRRPGRYTPATQQRGPPRHHGRTAMDEAVSGERDDSPAAFVAAAVELLAKHGATDEGFRAVGARLRRLARQPGLIPDEHLAALHGSAAASTVLHEGADGTY